VIGAAYLSMGPDVATALVLRLVAPLLADPERFGAAMDPKTSLQELSARHGKGLPHYEVTDSGPDHSKRFHATVLVGGTAVATGDGSSKKQAEMAAALAAWTVLQRPVLRRSGPRRSSPQGSSPQGSGPPHPELPHPDR
jgi:ribonuclease-3